MMVLMLRDWELERGWMCWHWDCSVYERFDDGIGVWYILVAAPG